MQTGSITLASTRLEGKQIVTSQRTQAPVSLACLLPPGTVAFRLATGGGGSELAAGSAQWPHTAVRHHRPSGTHTFGFTVEIRKATRKRHSHVGAVCEQGRHYKVRYSLFAHTKRKKKHPQKHSNAGAQTHARSARVLPAWEVAAEVWAVAAAAAASRRRKTWALRGRWVASPAVARRWPRCDQTRLLLRLRCCCCCGSCCPCRRQTSR